ncbi:MAG: hypothetical protein WCQ95_14090 [Bacteroidota bacterium]
MKPKKMANQLTVVKSQLTVGLSQLTVKGILEGRNLRGFFGEKWKNG